MFLKSQFEIKAPAAAYQIDITVFVGDSYFCC